MSEPAHRRIQPAVAGAVVAAFVLGGILAIVVDRATRDDTGTLRSSETVSEAPVATIEELPPAPLRTFANIVQYPAGYTARLINNGPAFTFVDLGRVQIETATRRAVYATGAFFYLEAGELYTFTVLNDVQLSVLRLVPEGTEPTTEVP